MAQLSESRQRLGVPPASRTCSSSAPNDPFAAAQALFSDGREAVEIISPTSIGLPC